VIPTYFGNTVSGQTLFTSLCDLREDGFEFRLSSFTFDVSLALESSGGSHVQRPLGE
jgi:hypothetical protein